METKNHDTKRPEGHETRPWDKWMSCAPSGAATASCCGMDVAEMADGRPCGAFFKEHRFAIFTAITVMGLTFLIVFAGFILGIIAFFRTL